MAQAAAASETVGIEALPYKEAYRSEGLYKGSCRWYLPWLLLHSQYLLLVCGFGKASASYMAQAAAASETVGIEALPYKEAYRQEGLYKGSCRWYLPWLLLHSQYLLLVCGFGKASACYMAQAAAASETVGIEALPYKEAYR